MPEWPSLLLFPNFPNYPHPHPTKMPCTSWNQPGLRRIPLWASTRAQKLAVVLGERGQEGRWEHPGWLRHWCQVMPILQPQGNFPRPKRGRGTQGNFPGTKTSLGSPRAAPKYNLPAAPRKARTLPLCCAVYSRSVVSNSVQTHGL